MKRTFILAAASMLLAGFSVFADQQILIDFTNLQADCMADENGEPTENARTVMDFSSSAGATFTAMGSKP